MGAALSPGEIVELLQLEPLPEEGGMFRQTYRDGHSTAIYFLLADGDFSALHRLSGAEVYHWYAGDPVGLLLLHPGGRAEEVVLGPDLRAGQRPQHPVPGGVWQGSSSRGSWSLLGTTMAPEFAWEGFELGERTALQREYPAFAERIGRLTRG